jgi:O-antigen/teichoic acid export membrane protein
LIKEHTNKIFKDTLLVVISNLVNYASTFVIAIFISRFLGVGPLGEFTLIFAFSAVLSVMADFGFSTLLIRKINENRHIALSYTAQINRFKLFSSIILIILLIMIFYFFSRENLSLTFAFGLLLIVPKAFQATYESSIRAKLNQKLPALIKSMNSLVQLILAYLLLNNGFMLYELFLMLLITETITAAVFRIIAFNLWKNELSKTASVKPPVTFMSLVKETLPFFGSNVLSFSIPRVTAILLGYIASASALGVFSAASRFAGGIGLLSGALFNSYYPLLSQKDADPLHKYLLTRRFLLFSFSGSLMIAAALFFLSDFLIKITFRIEGAVPVLKIMSFAVIPVLTYTVLQSYMLSIHKEKFILKVYSVIWLVHFVLGFILISNFSYTGAAITSIISEYLLMAVIVLGFFRYGKNLQNFR